MDDTEHDTTSILATIEHRFGLAPLTTRDAAVADLFRAPVFPGNRQYIASGSTDLTSLAEAVIGYGPA